jgi:hypothetical protein
MFKGSKNAKVHIRLEEHRRRMGYPAWLTVTMSDKGSYKEHDVISFLKAHLEEWKEGRDWRIIFADAFAAHKTENVFALCWSRGYVLILHGGGATPVAQTPDTDLNEEVRRLYGNKESAILMEKMRCGQVVPKMTQEECMDLMHSVLSDKELHKKAARGYKKVGQSVDLHGQEDNLIVREAAIYWNEATSDGHKNMREKVNDEMALVAEHFADGHLVWNKECVRKLINAYPKRLAVDKVLEKVGEDFAHDDIHCLSDVDSDEEDKLEGDHNDSEDETAVAADHASDVDEEESAGSDGDGEPAVAAICDGLTSDADVDNTSDAIGALSGQQADAVLQSQVQISSLQGAIEAIKATGQPRMVQHMEREIATLKRRQRDMSSESQVVADAFKRLRTAEDEKFRERMFIAQQTKALKRSAQAAIDAKKTAVAELAKAKRALQNEESKFACGAAIKTFSLPMLGANDNKAGGAAARKNRWEVLDRLARNGAALSPSQRNDFDLWKRIWDEAMVEEHKGKWADTFAGWMQNIVASSETNAFSTFMQNETNRVVRKRVTHVLTVPGAS